MILDKLSEVMCHINERFGRISHLNDTIQQPYDTRYQIVSRVENISYIIKKRASLIYEIIEERVYNT